MLSVGGFFLSAAFHDFVIDEFDDQLTHTINSMIGGSEVAVEGYVRFTRPLADQRFVEPYSGRYWQVSTQGQQAFRSRSLWDLELESDLEQPSFTQRLREVEGPDGQILRLAERDVVLPGSDAIFRYMAAADMAEAKAQMARFDRIVAWSLGGLGLGLLFTIVLQVTFGLSPLRRIRTGLADVRSGKTRRLDRRYPPEILPLVREVNAVLDHNQELVDRARTHVGNLAHALKTPLSVITNEAATAKNTKLSKTVEEQAGEIRRYVDHHLARARAMARHSLLGVRTDVGKAIADLTRALERIYLDRGLVFEVDAAEDLCFWGEREDLDEILGNLMDNAAKWAKSKVRVEARLEVGTAAQAESDEQRKEAWVIITIEDDGPGVDEQKRAQLFERGERLDEGVPGSGLGLSIVKDIAELCGGSVELRDAALGGLGVVVRLPAVTE